MRSLKKPTETPEDAFLLCVDGVTDLDKKKKYLRIKSDIVRAGQAYEAAAINGTLHTIPSADNVGSVVTVKEMSELYARQMVRGNGRELYEKLRSAPSWNECPLCAQRPVGTLDHHLPESKFPALAVNAQNLVPACRDCNSAKLALSATTSDKQIIHPYFDDFECDEWLSARIVERAPPALTFLVKSPTHWSDLKKKKALWHMKVLSLYELYSTNAGQELVNIRGYLVDLSTSAGTDAGPDAIRRHLAAEAKSRQAVHLNSWQAAMYSALRDSEWFCTQGFEKIPTPK